MVIIKLAKALRITTYAEVDNDVIELVDANIGDVDLTDKVDSVSEWLKLTLQ